MGGVPGIATTSPTPCRPTTDGTLAAARLSARARNCRAKAANTREAYRWAERVWCAWCDTHGLSAGADVAAFLAAERDRGLSPNTLDLRGAAIRYRDSVGARGYMAGQPLRPRAQLLTWRGV
jgi:hypothetical protein